MTTWFTADTHAGHSNIIRYTGRPFKDAEEMDRCLIERWNSVVGPEDIVYHLGDLSLNGWQLVEKFVWRLNGVIKLVPGNHDSRWIEGYGLALLRDGGLALEKKLEILEPLVSLRLPAQEFRDIHVDVVPRCIVLCHYGMRVWDSSHKGSQMIYGHSHERLPPHGKSFDVGVDGHDFTPWSLLEVQARMKGLEVAP